MSTTPTNEGGPAFPVNTTNEQNAGAYYPHAGMSLRDYFAAKAMHAYLSADTQQNDTNIARAAYALADAMISARNQTKK